MRRSLATAVGVLLGAVLASTATAQTIRIGSWNIEQLGSPGSRGGNAEGIAQTPQDLANHIADAAVDVLALQEIGDRANPGRVSPTLNETFAILNANGASWTYQLTANRRQNDMTQLTGVAWNRRVVNQVGEPYRFAVMPPSNGLNHWDRHPSAFRFRAQTGGTDFVVVSLHLKAGSSDTNRRQRREEVQALVERLSSFRSTFSEYDLVLIGDTNVRSTSEPTLSVITNAGFVDLNAAGQTTVPWGNAPFDHIFLATGQPEFASSTMVRVVTNNGAQRRRLSDHFLVYTDISVQADDDAPGGDIPDPPTDGSAAVLTIVAALPDPVGPDADSESVTLGNGGASDVSLDGWTLMDRSGNVFVLSGVVPASATLSVTVDEDFALNQNGDDIRLLNAAGELVHEVSYTNLQVVRGEFITF